MLLNGTQSEEGPMVEPFPTTAAVTEELAGGGAGTKESADVPPSMGLEERPRRRKKKIRNRDAQQVAEGEGTEEAETRIQRVSILALSLFLSYFRRDRLLFRENVLTRLV